ncbi:histidine phosphatase family protein [Nitratireductor aquimarinus]|uniref:SixA phosphatase family protein n=1 Tax=Nitratireductor TaxID=245876 RepID=UPI0019D37E7E|nr:MULTISPECIES: histidine phosphatase family protein [Nitratireductor]MBN7778183.1 histidine phosphatase family protein [Nitratireductor pacificus]MBN7782505.1 histidine phosphatase family protein [Nitratireductor pacificus]MBN7791312.1 histidine phosphatase family protein [Nitratireductor aquimarinus]MBY6100392.1 histidine phosphatase family protein [Nitratireductor aquimarinus]MCA1260578.1 histidine phosphatase family protein [Nitratireductor aquimarinus]
MTRLLLLRHAKAGWAAPGMSDFDRTLTASGQEDARALGKRMRATHLLPDLILCSTARRAIETLDGVSSTMLDQKPETHFLAELYNSDATDYLFAVREAPQAETILVVGHNPMMEDLAYELSSGGDAEATQAASSGFPTCGLAVISFPGALANIERRNGRLDMFLRPDRG